MSLAGDPHGGIDDQRAHIGTIRTGRDSDVWKAVVRSDSRARGGGNLRLGGPDAEATTVRGIGAKPARIVEAIRGEK